MITVLLVDDHDLVRTGVKSLLSTARGIKVVGEADSGEEALKFARELSPNVVLMDFKMPGIGGLEATKKLLRHDPDIKVIALTACQDNPFPTRFLKAGAMGYMTKDSDTEEIVHAIHCVCKGQRYISPRVAQQMVVARHASEDSSPFDELSEREMQIMLMITSGQDTQEIAKTLALSAKTVNTYRYRLFEKLNIKNDVELTHLAIRHGIIDSESVNVSD